MGVTGLALYTSALLGILCLLLSAITVLPGGERDRDMLAGVAGCGALVGAAGALGLGQLGRDHWVHQSRPLRLLFATAAVAVTLAVVLVV